MSALASAVGQTARADSEAANVSHVATDDYGRCFAHSVPDERYGIAGRTDVYEVGAGYPPDDELVLVHIYDWYASQMHVACNVSNGEGTNAPVVVQIGPWPRGNTPNDETLAIAFHYNGETLAEHSTLDIANGDLENASCSISHYTVVQAIEGFERNDSDGKLLFRLTTVDGRRLTFNALTGALIEEERAGPQQTYGECLARYVE